MRDGWPVAGRMRNGGGAETGKYTTRVSVMSGPANLELVPSLGIEHSARVARPHLRELSHQRFHAILQVVDDIATQWCCSVPVFVQRKDAPPTLVEAKRSFDLVWILLWGIYFGVRGE